MAAINVWDTDIIGGIPTDGFHGIIVASQALYLQCQWHLWAAGAACFAYIAGLMINPYGILNIQTKHSLMHLAQ